MTKEETKIILAIIAETYQRFEYSETLVSIWTSVFSKESVETVKKAILKIIESDKFAPTPARVKEAIEEEDVEKAKQALTMEERDILEIDPATVWAGAHRKMLKNREKYKDFLNSQVVPRWIKDAFEAVGGIELCTMGDDSRLYPRFEKAWNDGKTRFLDEISENSQNRLSSNQYLNISGLVKAF